MLHARRRRRDELARREAEGEDFWTDEFSEASRNRLLLYYQDCASDFSPQGMSLARDAILRDEGKLYLAGPQSRSHEDMATFLLTCDSAMMPTVVEALHLSLTYGSRYPQPPYGAQPLFAHGVKVVLREHRIAYDFIEGKMIEMESQELHHEVVVPVLRLLSGRIGWEPVESAYQDALGELGRGASADAITDAGTALQQALEIVGCDGNALGPLIKSAKAKGLLGRHDENLIAGVEKFLQWSSAERSNGGDSHHSAESNLDDAWLMVHIVGALILRLTAGPRASAEA